MTLEQIANLYFSIIVNMCPKDTRNLVRSIKLTPQANGDIIIDIGDDSANYARDTNEWWQIDLNKYKNKDGTYKASYYSLKSKNTGGVNPNYQWLDKALEQSALLVGQEMNRMEVSQ